MKGKRGHTVEGVMPQEAGQCWASWVGRGTLLKQSHDQLQVLRGSQAVVHIQKKQREEAEKPTIVRFLQKYQ